MELFIAILIVALIVPFAFHGTDGCALIGDIGLVIFLFFLLRSCS